MFVPKSHYAQLVRLALLLILALLTLALPSQSLAQAPPSPNILVTLAPIDRKTGVELSALTVDANIYESEGRTFAQGTMTWQAHHTDPGNETTIVVGFHEWASAS